MIFGRVSFSSFKQVEFKNAVIKYSYYCNSECVLNFLNVETIIIQHTNFLTSLSQGAESLVFAKNVNTAVLANCSFVGYSCNFSSVVNICSSKITIEQCTFKGYHIPFVLLGIGVYFEAQEINYSITTCSFNNNTAVYLIYVLEALNFISGFMNISNTIFQNTLFEKQRFRFSVLIFIKPDNFEKENLVDYLLNNNTIKNNVGSAIVGFGRCSQFETSNTKISSNIANNSIILFLNKVSCTHSSDVNITLVNTHIVNNSIPQFDITDEEPYSVVHVNGGLFQMKNVAFVKNAATPLALFSTSVHFMATNTFQNNIAMYGGGIYYDSDTTVTMCENSKVVFANNTARGAVYIDKTYNIYYNCLIDVLQTTAFYLIFSGNSARTGTGANIYSYQSWCHCHAYHIPNITWDTDPLIVSYPTNINISNKILEIYPGKKYTTEF